MENIQHRTVSVNGIYMHVAELGQGPVILFLHGFPEFWYSWRHQMKALASHGYRAVAPDLRGFGDTEAPESVTSYTLFHVVGDLIELIDVVAGEQEKVFVVGHDWGALAAWYLCLLRPDRVKALVNTSVVFQLWFPKKKPVEGWRKIYGDDVYICRFQEPGEIEAEFAKLGTETVIKKFLTYRDPYPFIFPKDKGFGHSPDAPISLPPWLPEEAVDYYIKKFGKTGFTGGVNYYRNIDLNSELTAPWTGAKVEVPVKFIVGDLDCAYHFTGVKEYIDNGGFKNDVPLLKEMVVMEGVGHFINQEKPDEISEHIYDFFKRF